MFSELGPFAAELITQWSVRIAIACYLVRVFLDLGCGRESRSRSVSKLARLLWTIGFVFYLLHVACAFQFFHHWSHERAMAHTAMQTAAITGVQWGGGLFFNYAFTFYWGFDTFAWWRRDVTTYGRGRIYFWILHGVFAFMVFNATVVFGPPVWKWVAVVVGIIFTIVYVRSKSGKRSPTSV